MGLYDKGLWAPPVSMALGHGWACGKIHRIRRKRMQKGDMQALYLSVGFDDSGMDFYVRIMDVVLNTSFFKNVYQYFIFNFVECVTYGD